MNHSKRLFLRAGHNKASSSGMAHQPATDALKALTTDASRDRYAPKQSRPSTVTRSEFDLSCMLHQAMLLSTQDSEPCQFPTIAWFSDSDSMGDTSVDVPAPISDDELESEPRSLISNEASPASPKRKFCGSENSNGSTMKRSKALYANLSLLADDALSSGLIF
jgi:hypothetical protein